MRSQSRLLIFGEDSRFLLSIGLTTGLVCFADITFPLGHVPWILYFIPLALSFQMRNRRAPLPFAALCSLLIGTGFVFAPPEAPLPTAAFNRLTGVITLWFVAWFLVQLRARQDQLGQAEERWRILAHHTHDILWEWDITTNDHWWSANARTFFNYDPESEPSLQAWSSRLHPDDRRRVTEDVQRAIVGEDSGWTDEYRFRTADGSYRSYLDRGTILRAPDGKAVRVIEAMIDVTDRKERENALALFRSLLDQATDAIEIIDPETGRFLDCNERAHADLGYTRDEFLALSVPDIAPSLMREDWAIHVRSLPETESSPIESVHRRKDGSVFSVEISWRVVRLDRPYLLAIVRDITVRKRTAQALRLSEERYRDLVERIDGIVWEADARTFAFTFVSRHAEALLGYPVQQWLDDPNFWPDHIHPDDRDATIRFCLDHTASGTAHRFEYRMIGADGRTVWVYDTVTVIRVDGIPRTLQGVIIDITERKRIESALRESEDRFRQAYHHASMGIGTADLAGHISHVNPAMCTILGYEAEELYGRTFQSLTHPDDLPADLERTKELMAGPGTHQEFEKRCVRKDGTQVWVTVDLSLIRTAEGTPSHLLAMVQDITDRKQAQEALRESEQLKNAVLNSVPSHIAVLAQDGTILAVNEPWSQFCRQNRPGSVACTSCEDVGRNYLEACGSSSDTPIQGAAAQNGILRVLRGESDSFTQEYPCHSPMAARWFTMTVTPLVTSGQRGAVICHTDITPLKQVEQALRDSERRFRLLFERAPLGITVFDKQKRYVTANQAFCDLVGYSAHELMGRSCTLFTHPDDLQGDRHAADSLLAHQQHEYRLEQRYIRKDGATIWVAVNAVYADMPENPEYGIIAFIEDITERKLAEETARHRQQELRLLLEAFPAVLWTMSPDLHFTSSTGRGLTTLELTPGEVVGQSLQQFMRGRGDLRPILDQHRRALKGERVTLELATNVATFHTHVEPLYDGRGRIVGTIGIAMDITDRKRNEEALRTSTERLQLALKTSEMGVWEWDVATDRIYWSDECFRIFGLLSFEGTLQAFRRLVHPDYREALCEAMECARAARTPVTLEFQFVRSDGAVRWASTLGNATYDQAGQVTRITGTVQDVTARKAADTELHEAYDRLRDVTLRLTQAEELERGRISRELHDEFGQALTALQFDLFSIRKRLESGSIPRHDPAVLERVSNMITLTERTMAAIHYMTTVLRPAMLDQLGLFPALQASIEEFSLRTGINCEFTTGPDRTTVPVDSHIATATYRIVQELLTNVIRHANASHVNIVLDIQDDRLELEFQDNGIGVTPDQAHATTSYGILGMQERAALLGGSFAITGTQGVGTRAVLTLPLSRQQAMQPHHD